MFDFYLAVTALSQGRFSTTASFYITKKRRKNELIVGREFWEASNRIFEMEGLGMYEWT
jgi:hypothetical protein